MGRIVAVMLLAGAGCVSSSHGPQGKDKLTSFPLGPMAEPVTDRPITAENAHVYAQALADELDREERQMSADPKESKALKH